MSLALTYPLQALGHREYSSGFPWITFFGEKSGLGFSENILQSKIIRRKIRSANHPFSKKSAVKNPSVNWLSANRYQIEKWAGFLCAISRSLQPIAYVPKFCRNFKTSKKKKKPVESEIETNGSVSGSTASDVGGVRLFAKSRSLLKPDEPVTETKRQTKPDLLAHRKVSVRSWDF